MDYRGNKYGSENVNLFEAQQASGNMPLPTEQDEKRLGRVGVEAISSAMRGDEQFNVVDLEQEPVDNLTRGDMGDTSNKVAEVMTDDAPTFSGSQEFTKGDGEITEGEIKKLTKNPAKGYISFQADRIAYLEKSFGRTFGEGQGSGGQAA